MRQIKQFLLAVLVALASCVTASAYDFEATNQDGVTIYFNITSEEDRTCAVTRGSYNSSTIVIPSTVIFEEKEYDVTSIGNEAFYQKYSLKSVEIPSSITSIGSNAFRDCSGLTSIVIPNSVISIGVCAFYGCI